MIAEVKAAIDRKYLARPAAVPQEVNPDAVKIIREKSREI